MASPETHAAGRTGAAGATRPLRLRLFMLAASGLVPLALVLLAASAYLANERRTQTERSAIELSRAVASAVDAELRSTIAVLESLAITTDMADLSPAQLEQRDLPATLRRVRDSRDWLRLTVADAGGRVLLGETIDGGKLLSFVEPGSAQELVKGRKPVIGSIARGPSQRDGYAVRIPVMRGDRLQYILSAAVSTNRMLAVIARQQVADSWVLALFDREGNRVARSRDSASTRWSPSLEALVRAKGLEGGGATRTVEGEEAQTGFSRVRTSQWVVAVGIPASIARDDLYRLVAAVGTGIAASLGLLAWLALRMTRGISRPIDELKSAAHALGAGRALGLPHSDIAELEDVGAALRQAAQERDEAAARRDAAQAEREKLLARIEDALREAERANRNKDEFLALLGHELRNPLAPIMNAVHLIGLKGDDRTLPERRIIQRQLSYVTRLVDDLLDASRITGQRFSLTLRPVRPVPVLEQTVESHRPGFGERKVRLRIEEAARSVWVQADEARLVQVFNNLLGNAAKFTSPTGRIDVEARLEGDAICMTFRDDGVGMSTEEVSRAFDLFWQAPNSARGVSGGLGLGLAIVKSIVEMHGGRVRATSEGHGRGSCVEVVLPLAAAPDDDGTSTRRIAAGAALKLLIVDDNEDAADTLSTLLQLAGFTVQVAYTPQSALDAVASFAPQVAILDIGLPEIDGYELARRLRGASPPFTGKLVALTGYGQQQDIDRALAAGFDAHLTKPVEPDRLFEVLSGLLGNRAPPAD